jgi:hypothetical protein
MAQNINTSEIRYQERWQSARTGGIRVGGPGGLSAGSTQIQGLLKILVLADRIILRPMGFVYRLIPKFFNYEVPFDSIIRCDVHKKGILGKGIEMEFQDQAGKKMVVEFSAKDPDKIKQLCMGGIEPQR